MAYSLVTSGSGQESGGVWATITLNTTGADFLVFAAASSSSAFTPSDNKGNSFLTAFNEIGTGAVRLWYCANANVGTNHTFTFTNTDGPAIVMAFSGGKYLSPLDAVSSANSSSASTQQPGTTGTPSENNCIVVSALGTSAGPSATINSGFSVIASVGGLGGDYTISLAYKIQTTAGAENPTWTGSASGSMLAGIAVFKSEPFGRICNETIATAETQTYDGTTSKSDTASVVDTPAAVGAVPTQADTASVSDGQSFSFAAVIAETITTVETQAFAGTTSKSDTATNSDIASAGVPLATVTDTSSVVDGQSVAIVANLSDTATVNDAQSFQGQTAKADTAAVIDALSSQVGATIDELVTVTENLGFGDVAMTLADTADVDDVFAQSVSLGKTYILTENLPYGT